MSDPRTARLAIAPAQRPAPFADMHQRDSGLLLGGYFYSSASVEGKDPPATFPTAYPAYQAQTKMLIPRVL